MQDVRYALCVGGMQGAERRIALASPPAVAGRDCGQVQYASAILVTAYPGRTVAAKGPDHGRDEQVHSPKLPVHGPEGWSLREVL